MRLFLHIGVEKTGSTSIQKFLLINRQNLLKQKIYFPDDLDILDQKNGNCVGLSLFTACEMVYSLRYCSSLFTKVSIEDYQTAFEQSLEEIFCKAKKLGCHTFILSNEHLSSRLDTQEIKIIHRLLYKYFSDVKILVYLREQTKVIPSLYSTYLNGGGSLGFLDFLSESHKYINHQYNYEALLRRWGNEFGESNIIPRLYCENVHFDIAKQISPNFNYVNNSFSSNILTNVSLNRYQLFLKRQLNLFSKKIQNNTFPLSLFVFKIVFVITYKMMGLLSYIPNSNFSSQALNDEIKNHFDFEKSNKYVANKYYAREQLFKT